MSPAETTRAPMRLDRIADTVLVPLPGSPLIVMIISIRIVSWIFSHIGGEGFLKNCTDTSRVPDMLLNTDIDEIVWALKDKNDITGEHWRDSNDLLVVRAERLCADQSEVQ